MRIKLIDRNSRLCILRARPVNVLLAAMLGTAGAHPALAQDGQRSDPAMLEEIVVTATKREERLQDIPISTTAMSGEALVAGNIANFDALFKHVPGANFFTNASRQNSFAGIRGVQRTRGRPTTIFNVDGVNQSNNIGTSIGLREFYDIERVEILRGPQATLYGRNASGGVVNLITRKPTDVFEGELEVGAGNYNLRRVAGVLSGPIVNDKVTARLAAYHKERDGYVRNTLTGNDMDHDRITGGRLQVQFRPSDALSVLAAADIADIDEGAFSYARTPSLREVRRYYTGSEPQRNELKRHTYSITADYDFPAARLTSISAHDRATRTSDIDYDFSASSLADFRFTGDLEFETFSQELRLASDGSGKWRWLIGLFYSDERDLQIQRYAFLSFNSGSVNTTRQRTRNVGLFGEASYDVTDRLELTAGLRAAYEESEIDFTSVTLAGARPAVNIDSSTDEILPKLALTYALSDDANLYGTISRGFTGGGFNTAGLTPQERVFDPEFLWNYEIGLKSSWLDNRLVANAAVYYQDWEDMQLAVNVGTVTQFRPLTANAASARNRGVELELLARPWPGLDLSLAYGYVDARFRDYVDETNDDRSGQRLVATPNYNLSAAIQYSAALGESASGYLRMESLTRGRQMWMLRGFGDLQPDPSVTRLNLRAGLRFGRWEINGYIDNLTDEDELSIIVPFVTGDPTVPGLIAEYRPPRTYGANVRVSF